jgi:hypothetical protein
MPINTRIVLILITMITIITTNQQIAMININLIIKRAKVIMILKYYIILLIFNNTKKANKMYIID